MTVEERLDALEKEVQRLRDIEAIKELKGKYFRCLDGKNGTSSRRPSRPT